MTNPNLVYAVNGLAVGAGNLLYHLDRGIPSEPVPADAMIVDWHVDNSESVEYTDESLPELKSKHGLHLKRVAATRSDIGWRADGYLFPPYEVRRIESGYSFSKYYRHDLANPDVQLTVAKRLIEASHDARYQAVMYSFSKPYHSAKPDSMKVFEYDHREMKIGDKWSYATPGYSHQNWWSANIAIFRQVREQMNQALPLILDTRNHGVEMWRYIKRLDDSKEQIFEDLADLVDMADHVVGSSREPEQRNDENGAWDLPDCLRWMMGRKSVNEINVRF